MVPVALRQLGQLVGELEQQLQPVPHLEREEVLSDLGELREAFRSVMLGGRDIVGDLPERGRPALRP